MSATRTSPHSSRPGSSRWPGFRRKKVTVRVACTTAPSARPVVPSRPLGTSTASTGLPDALMAATTSAATPSSGRESPAPNSASTMTSAPAERSGRQRLDIRPPALSHSGRIAVEPLARPRSADPHAIALLPQQPRRHKAVAAVVAGPAHHGDRRALAADQVGGRIGHRAAGRLHQGKPRRALPRSPGGRRGPFPRRSAVHAQARRHLAQPQTSEGILRLDAPSTNRHSPAVQRQGSC